MNFAHPRVLWVAAVLLPLLALFLWATWRKRQALVRQFVQHKMLAELAVGASAALQKWRRVLLLGAVAFLLLAVARPQWGFVWEEATQRGRDIVIAIDASRSMLAEDLQPNRLARAKLAALDLLKLGQYDRFGLVAFAGTAFLQCPLTFDEEAFRQSVQILEPGILPQGGTAIGPAIDSAREAFGSESDDNHKVLVLFTDGEDHEEGVMQTVERAANEGVKIFTIGAGTPGGELLRVRDEKGNQVFVKDAAGNVVKSRLNEELLRQIATTAHGFYLPLNAANAMEVLYQKGLAPLAASERSTKLMKRLNDQFYWPLALAIILLIVEVLIPDQKRARRRAGAGGSRPPVAAAVGLLVLLLSAAEASGGPSASSALRKYKKGDFNSALDEYRQLIAKQPNDPRLRFNAGAAAFQADHLSQAIEHFTAAAASSDLDLQQQALYNLGRTEYQSGEETRTIEERISHWESSLRHFESALRLSEHDQDAAFNRDVVKKKLEELKKQQQEQENQQGDPNQDNKDEQKQGEDPKDNQGKQDQKEQQDQKDNSQKDNSQEGAKDQEQKSQQQQQEEKEQQQKQQASKKGEENKDSQASQSGGQKESDKNDPQNAEGGQMAQLGKMTPAQARQLLDAQRGEEKALLFIPQDKKAAARDRVFKDW